MRQLQCAGWYREVHAYVDTCIHTHQDYDFRAICDLECLSHCSDHASPCVGLRTVGITHAHTQRDGNKRDRFERVSRERCVCVCFDIEFREGVCVFPHRVLRGSFESGQRESFERGERVCVYV